MNPMLLAIDTQLMWNVIIAGIVIVFAVLILLVGIFYLFGAVMQKTTGKERAPKPAKKQAAPKPAPRRNVPAAASNAPVVGAGIPLEVVAAISAAVAELQGGKPYAIRSIQQQPRSARPAWAMAGVMENTRPF